LDRARYSGNAYEYISNAGVIPKRSRLGFGRSGINLIVAGEVTTTLKESEVENIFKSTNSYFIDVLYIYPRTTRLIDDTILQCKNSH